MQNDILQSLDQNEIAVLVLLDLSAAFGTIDHETLLHRLEYQFGKGDTSRSWMRSYLTDRYQTVCIDGKMSKPVRMQFSVPQGSVLGPKFYTMYTKPVGLICKKYGLRHHFYADDSQLYISFKPIDSFHIVSAHAPNCLLQRYLREITREGATFTNVPFVILPLMERLLPVRNVVSGFILPVLVSIKLQLVPYMMMYHISAYYAMTINCIPIAILTRKCLRKNKLLIL